MTLGKSLQNIYLELLLAITIAKRRIWANDAVSPTKKNLRFTSLILIL